MSIYIDSEISAIGRFLSSEMPIRVPSFQRSYSWTDEEVKQLWTDITEAIDSNDSEYFLGPMVIKKESDFYEIIDGQQRITTIFIILSVIRRYFRQNGDDQRADWFRNKYFGEQDILTLETKPRFHMNEENDITFQKYVVADSSETQIKTEMKGRLRKDTNLMLLQAVSTIWESMNERQMNVTSKSFDADTLLKLHAYIQDSVQILILKVKDEADAFVIFETLNDRGRSLNTIDLLKNHIFGLAGSHLNQAKALWASLRENLSEIDPSEKFLYQFWASEKGRTPKTKLFRLMRKEIKNSKSSVDFLSALNETSKIYAALNMSGHPFWNEYDQTTRNNLETLRILDTQQSIPLLLAAAKKFTHDEFRKLTEILIVITVRYNLIGELRTGVIANYFSEIPPKISSGAITKAAKVFRDLKPVYPKDTDFQEAFEKKSLKDARKARYVLSEIENYTKRGGVEVASDPRTVNLEHILPKNPSNDWAETVKSIDPDDLSDYVYRIGNMALVSATNNKVSGSKGFAVKKINLFSKEISITTTNMINEYEVWTQETIVDRQSRLAKLAVKVWRIDID